jgi:hypothetical protein
MNARGTRESLSAGAPQAYNLCLKKMMVQKEICCWSVIKYIPPLYRCAIPSYANDTYEVQSDAHLALINASIPEGESCTLYDTEQNGSLTTTKCFQWVYDQTYYSPSVSSEVSQHAPRPTWGIASLSQIRRTFTPYTSLRERVEKSCWTTSPTHSCRSKTMCHFLETRLEVTIARALSTTNNICLAAGL